MQIARDALAQMGGHLHAMINARDILALERGVQFRFSGCRKANKVQIIVTWRDTYDMTFYKQGRLDCPEVHRESDLYNDMLMSTFTAYTGLDLTIGEITRGRAR